MEPRWNLIYQNVKVLTTGRVDVEEGGQTYSTNVGRDTDCMFYNYVVQDDLPTWATTSTGWLGLVLFICVLTLILSGYVLFRFLAGHSMGATTQAVGRRKGKK